MIRCDNCGSGDFRAMQGQHVAGKWIMCNACRQRRAMPEVSAPAAEHLPMLDARARVLQFCIDEITGYLLDYSDDGQGWENVDGELDDIRTRLLLIQNGESYDG